jgi:cytoskeletal protein CcmA (bactofilin family)
MFGKEGKEEVRPAPDRNTTIIGNGACFNGVVKVNGSLRIDGEVEGQLQVTEAITVGPTGVVKAEISANSAIIGGRIKGRIWAKDKVVLQRGSRLEGDVHAALFKIEDGAFFQGNCAMGGEAGKGGAAEPPRDAAGQGRNLQVVG